MSRWSEDYGNARLIKKHSLPPEKHLMGKPESKVMRKLKKLTKMTEEEIRSIKKYRKMLADAATSNGKNTHAHYNRHFHLVRRILVGLKLPLDHPKVREKLKEELVNIISSDYNKELRDIGEYGIYYHMVKDDKKIDKIIKNFKRFNPQFDIQK